MTTVPNIDIQHYLDDLLDCKEQALRDLNKANAECQAARQVYQRQLGILQKLKNYLAKLEATDQLATDALQSLNVTQQTAEKVKASLELDAQAIACLTKEIHDYSKQLEIYKNCLNDLLLEIEKIKKAKFNHDNPIVKALNDLKTAYEEAIQAATNSLVELYQVLQCAFVMKFKMVGMKDGPGSNSACYHGTSGDGPVTIEGEFYKGLIGSLDHIEEKIETQFSIIPADPQNPADKQQYAAIIINAIQDWTEAIEGPGGSREILKEKTEAKSNAQSIKQAADKAYEAAVDAKKC